jgi:hypothetical protein
MFPMCALQTCQHCNDGVVHRLCIPQMMENRLWCAECCRSKEVGDANADSDNLDLLARVSATATLKDDDDPTSRNKGGRPKGSTDAKKRDKAMQVLDACNWVCNKYAAEQDKNNGTAPAGLRRELR